MIRFIAAAVLIIPNSLARAHPHAHPYAHSDAHSDAEGDPFSGFEAGFIKGVRLILPLMSQSLAGDGDRQFHIATYNFRLSIASQVARGLERNESSLPDPALRQWLGEFVRNIRGAPQAGRSDVRFWVRLLERRYKDLLEIEDPLRDRPEMTAPVDALELPGFLKGLYVGVGAMIDQNQADGNIDYYVRLFNLHVANVDFIAGVLEQGAGVVREPFARLMLAELAKDLRSIPRNGRGNIHYWSGPLREHQMKTIVRVIEKLDALITFTATPRATCEGPLLDEGLVRFDLKDI